VSKIPPADTMGYYIFRMENITPCTNMDARGNLSGTKRKHTIFQHCSETILLYGNTVSLVSDFRLGYFRKM